MTMATATIDLDDVDVDVETSFLRSLIEPATLKQTAFITRLVRERDVVEGWDLGFDLETKEGASATITYLLGLPRKPIPEMKPGFYTMGGETYRVIRSGSGRLYAKRFTSGRWQYAPGVIGRLASGNPEPLTLAEAAAYGKAYGICMMCERTLTNENSIARGIGPVCAQRLDY